MTTSPPPQPPARPPSRGVVLTLAVATVVAVGVISLLPFLDDLRGGDDAEVVVATAEPTTDTFDRPDADTLADADHPWEAASGTWVVQDGHAALTAADPGAPRSLAVLPTEAGTVARVTARAIEPGWAFAFRVVDPDNLWSLIARPATGSWSLEVVRDGVATETARFLIAPPADGDRIEVRLVGDRIAVTVNGTTSAELTDPTHAGVAAVGLLAVTADNVVSMAWDDLEVAPS